MEALIVLLIIGFCIYWLIRHPLQSAKIVGGALGLLLLGLAGVIGFWLILMAVLSKYPSF